MTKVSLGDVAPFDRGDVDNERVTFKPMHADSKDEGGTAPLPPEQRIGIAVVGLGRLTVQTILPAFAQCKAIRLAALVSGSFAKLQTIGEQYGVPDERRYSYDVFEQLAEADDVDAVFIVLPNALHLPLTERAAAIGKHVLCEKPMAASSGEATAMIAACERAGVKLMIAYRCRYDAAHRKLIEIVRSGEHGAIKLIESVHGQLQGAPEQWRLKKALAGGGALPDIGIYCLNAARAVTGEEPNAIRSQIYSTPSDPRFTEVEETVSWLMAFPSGAHAALTTSYGVHKAGTLIVHLERATLMVENAFSYRGQVLKLSRSENGVETTSILTVDAPDMFSLELDHFADCIRHNRTPDTPGEEGLRDHLLMEEIYRVAGDGDTSGGALQRKQRRRASR